jgi:hypothetical protein
MVIGDLCLRLTLPSYYHNGMVFQHGVTGTIAWGFTTCHPEDVEVEFFCSDGRNVALKAREAASEDNRSLYDDPGSVWEAVVPFAKQGTMCAMSAKTSSGDMKRIKFYLGDVWFCSGQSNMEFPMNQVDNAAEEIADAAQYTNIRNRSIKYI